MQLKVYYVYHWEQDCFEIHIKKFYFLIYALF